MAWQPSVNHLILNANDRWGFSVWRLMRSLIDDGGWTVMGAGDGGSLYENTGDTAGPYDVLTVSCGANPYGSGPANSFGNTNAWFRIQMPGSTLEIQIRRNTSTFAGYQYVMAVDPLGFVNTGIADANTPPTGNATQFLHGATSWTNYLTYLGSNNEDQRIHVMVNDAAVNGVYSFWMAVIQAGSSAIRAGFTFAAMEQPSVGDPQPWVIQCRGATGVFIPSADLANDTNVGPQGFYDYGGGGENFSQFPGLIYKTDGNVQSIPAFVSAAPDGDYRHFPIIHASPSTGQYKGVNALAKYKSANGRNYPATYDLAGGNPRIVMGDLVLPWASGVVPL